MTAPAPAPLPAGAPVPAGAAGLVRSIGRWALAGLVLNGVIGSAIYGLPSVIARQLGEAAPWAWLLAAGLIGVVLACFAEVASRFRGAGGPYLYARVTFGRFAGLQTGWMAYLARLTASATVANLFVIYLGEFFPGVTARAGTVLVLTLLLGGLALVNFRGVGHGSRVSSLLALAKLAGLGIFLLLGLVWVAGHGAVAAPPAPPGVTPWLEALLVLVFAYGGFEAALMPLAEARDPERDAPFALFVALAAATAVYTLGQAVVTFTLPDAAASSRPLADSARVFFGAPGAGFLALCALLSTFGYLAGGMVNVPRLTFAMAEQGDLPRAFRAVHPRFRTPHVSIAWYAILVWALASSGTFLQNLTLSVAARLITYGLVCAALPVLRRRDGRPGGAPPAGFRLPGGLGFAALGVLGMIVMATQVKGHELWIMGVVVALATVHWRVALAAEQR
ncbi:MAG TPA: APC family permease [Gemmatimonadales bacterium]|nr:APC family permease [Gemmatimonadales bacterium]